MKTNKDMTGLKQTKASQMRSQSIQDSLSPSQSTTSLGSSFKSHSNLSDLKNKIHILRKANKLMFD